MRVSSRFIGLMSNVYNCTFYQWHNHFDVLCLAGFDLDDLEYIRLAAVGRINARQELTGEMLFNVTMVQLGFGNLGSVLLVNERLGGADGEIPLPRQLAFGDPEVPNPYDVVEVEEDALSEGVFEWEDVEPLAISVVEIESTSHLRSHRVRVVSQWV